MAVALATLVLTSCGGSEKKVLHPPPPETAEEEPGTMPNDDRAVVAKKEAASSDQAAKSAPVERESAAPTPYAGLPKSCASDGDLCVPPGDFTERLCLERYPGAAIAMFEKHAPWTRGYIRMREVESVNTLGGPTSETKLVFAEEVIILRKTGGNAGKAQVSGMGGYLVLRWDGTCSTLSDHELVTWVPAAPRHAPFPWKYIDTNIQEALLSNDYIREARAAQRKQCKAASLGRQSKACAKATERLNDRIVVAVRSGMDLPTPERLP